MAGPHNHRRAATDRPYHSLQELTAANSITKDDIGEDYPNGWSPDDWLARCITDAIQVRYPRDIRHNAKADRLAVREWCSNFIDRHPAAFKPELRGRNLETLLRQWTGRKSKIKKERCRDGRHPPESPASSPEPRSAVPTVVLVRRDVFPGDLSVTTVSLELPLIWLVPDGEPDELERVTLARLHECALANPLMAFKPDLDAVAWKPADAEAMTFIRDSSALRRVLRKQSISAKAPPMLYLQSVTPRKLIAEHRANVPTIDASHAATTLLSLVCGDGVRLSGG